MGSDQVVRAVDSGSHAVGPAFTRSVPLIRLAVLVLAALWPAAAAAQTLPDGPGKDTFESVCSLCHATTAVAGKLWTRPQWEAKVVEMLQVEPDVTSAERIAIVEYLSSHFKPGGKIYINYAAAKDLESALELSPKDAEAVVREVAERAHEVRLLGTYPRWGAGRRGSIGWKSGAHPDLG